ncbi:MAG: DNRLRE domain-containing protein [Longimicrobiales bacterium]
MKRVTTLAGAVLLLAGCQDTAGPVGLDVLDPQFSHVPPTATIIFPEADATVASGAPGSNFGSGLRLQVTPTSACGVQPYGRSHAFVRFDLSAIPQTATIVNATLQMTAPEGFAWGGDGTTYSTFVADDSWDEGTITWNNQPAAGALLGSWWIWSGYPCSGAYKGHRVGGFDITAQAQAELSSDKHLSIRLHNDGYWLSHYSREHGVGAQMPQLQITYQINDPTSKAQCMNGGWAAFHFKNQGQCVRFIETGKDSR